MRARVSVVMNTLNAEATIALALRSVKPWADEIVVVDMQSTDKTVAIAESMGAKVHSHTPLGDAAPARPFAVDQATNDWILLLDADELIPRPLSELLLDTAEHDRADVLVLPRLNFILGAPMTQAGWGPMQDTQRRFFKKGMLEIGVTLHGQHRPLPHSRVQTIEYAQGLGIVHFNYLGTTDFIDRLNRYTSVEVMQGDDAAPTVFGALRSGIREFLRRFVVRRGYRDGWRGFYLSAFMLFYKLVIHAKQTEAERVGSEDDMRKSYAEAAESLLAEYRPDRADTKGG